MNNGLEPYNKVLLDSLEKCHQVFMETTEGEINVYLALNKNDETRSVIDNEDIRNNMSFQNSNITDNTLNMLN